MATRQYIGARYVPKFYQNSVDGSTQWESNVVYDPLIWVTLNNGHMYISKKQVPATVGIPTANIDYWLDIGSYNGYIQNLQEQIDALSEDTQRRIQELYDTVQGEIDDINEEITHIGKSVKTYFNVAEMVADERIKKGDIAQTKCKSVDGDLGGALYYITDKVDDILLDNLNWAIGDSLMAEYMYDSKGINLHCTTIRQFALENHIVLSSAEKELLKYIESIAPVYNDNIDNIDGALIQAGDVFYSPSSVRKGLYSGKGRASAFSVMNNYGLEGVGVYNSSGLASYSGRDFVGIYDDVRAEARTVFTPTAVTATTITLAEDFSALTIPKGTIVDIYQTLDSAGNNAKYSGIIQSVDYEHKTLTVECFMQFGNAEPVTPNISTHNKVIINPVTKLWGMNQVCYLMADSHCMNGGTANEINLYNNDSTSAGFSGIDVVHMRGNNKDAFLVRNGTGDSTNRMQTGFADYDAAATSFYSENPTICGFTYLRSNLTAGGGAVAEVRAPRAANDGTRTFKLNIDSYGDIERCYHKTQSIATGGSTVALSSGTPDRVVLAGNSITLQSVTSAQLSANIGREFRIIAVAAGCKVAANGGREIQYASGGTPTSTTGSITLEPYKVYYLMIGAGGADYLYS